MYNKCNEWLGGWRVPLPGILGGFETLQKHFFEIFGVKEQKKTFGKYRKKLENVGKNREKLEKMGKKSGNRNFGGDILLISTENRNFGRNF